MNKIIKIHFCDFWKGFEVNDNFIINSLKKNFKVIIDEKQPDFLFCSCFSRKHVKFNCVKIFFTGENLTPDFNLYDYAIGFDFMDFEDRYLRHPLYKLYMKNEDCVIRDADFFINEATSKNKFCNFIYSNAVRAAHQREEFFHLLSQYKHVESGGKFLNNIGHCVDDKTRWQRNFKFSIAFENSQKNGYSTEKIFDALRAHTIPIYWGNPKIAQDFNPKRFINCHDFSSFDEVVAYVTKINESEKLYLEMISQPWFNGKSNLEIKEDTSLDIFLQNIVSQTPLQAQRTTSHGYTALHIAEQEFLHDAYGLHNIPRFMFFLRFIKKYIQK